MGGPFDRKHPETLRQACIRAVLDGDHELGGQLAGTRLSYGRAKRAAEEGKLRGYGKAAKAPSVTTISTWCREEDRRRRTAVLKDAADAETTDDKRLELVARAFALLDREMADIERQAARRSVTVDLDRLHRLGRDVKTWTEVQRFTPEKPQRADATGKMPATTATAGVERAIADRLEQRAVQEAPHNTDRTTETDHAASGHDAATDASTEQDDGERASDFLVRAKSVLDRVPALPA